MNRIKSFSLPDYAAAFIIACYFIAGLFITPDYGVNWDDPIQRSRIGIANWDFITHADGGGLIQNPNKYHGPAFEILLIAVEKKLHLTDTHDVFLSRHYMVFLFFTSVLIAFFLFCRRLFESSLLGLTGLLLLLLTPRIFGESFYNPKDIVFMGAMIWAMYTLLIFSESPSWGRALLHGFTCAFAADVRVIGIVMVPFTFMILALYLYQQKLAVKDTLGKILLYLLVFFAGLIAMWPILRIGPTEQIWQACKQMSNYVLWTGHTLFLGRHYAGIDTPRSYHWVWLLVSLPEIYILLFLSGILIFSAKVLRRKSIPQTKAIFILISLFFFFAPLVFRSITKSVVLDGWRHIYFVYPFFVVLAVYAMSELLLLRRSILRSLALGLVILALCDSLVSIVSMHPYQYVYFNHTANALLRPIDQKLELDYWGVSYKQGIEYVLAQTKDSARIKIAFANDPGYYNCQFLRPELRAHFEPVENRDSAQYFLSNYRDLQMPSPTAVPYTIKAQGNIVMGIYKLR